MIDVVKKGVSLPPFVYGTAWKEVDTQRLTALALAAGFRAIDTANQRKHYFESGVGQAVAEWIAQGRVQREELFLQTKFTFQSSQDHRLPYDPRAATRLQVEQSIQSSLEHLHTSYLDSYVLHGPSRREGLAAVDWEAWRTMEDLHASGMTRWLGISNVTLAQLRQLCEKARVPPRYVQNRCFASRGWDRDVRAFCRAHDIVYQGFSLLTANRGLLGLPAVSRIARRHGRTVNQIVFRFALDVGMLPLTGTTCADHMREDLDVVSFRLEPDEVSELETMASPPRSPF